MKPMRKLTLILLLALVAAFAWPQIALAQGPSGDKFVTGGAYTLEEGQTLNGNLFILGGIATLKAGSRVTGDVILTGGTIRASGQIDGNILATGGLIELNDTALVKGDVTTIAANLNRATGARIEGNVNSGFSGPFTFTIPEGVQMPEVRFNFNPFLNIFWYFTRSFLWAALALVVVLFAPRPAERVVQAVVVQPVITGGIGLLTAVVFPLLLVVIAITIIGIPVSLLGVFLLVVAWAFGLVSIGLEVGKRLAAALNQDWALPVSAGIGTFLLTLLINGIGFIDCIGWIPGALVGILAVGAVLLTRFGTQLYPPPASDLSLAAYPERAPEPPRPPVTPTIPPAVSRAEDTESQEPAQESPGTQGDSLEETASDDQV
ncbi:MAG: polymer-forming cytoskeletal protein [Anaerolineales bacterium]